MLEKLPNVKLLVVGKGNPGNELSNLLEHSSIVNYGMVERVDIYYQQASIAIVPLLSGSGTRLKLLEAMANKVPVISTSIGAEGINYLHEKNIMIGDNAVSFAKLTIQLLDDDKLAKEIADNALYLVQNEYDWNVIGEKMASYLN